MPKEVTTVSEEGFASTSTVRDFEIHLDATGEAAADTLESLLASYAACYVPALRVGGEQRGVDELGEIEISVTGTLNNDDKLDSISFDATVEADLDEETANAIIDRANALCKVHDAMKPSLHADVTLHGGA